MLLSLLPFVDDVGAAAADVVGVDGRGDECIASCHRSDDYSDRHDDDRQRLPVLTDDRREFSRFCRTSAQKTRLTCNQNMPRLVTR